MPIYLLDESIRFPSVEGAEDGIVAIGGDLSAARLLCAYQEGIFPWYSEDEPIIWWSPDPRFVLFPDELHISTSMKRVIRSNRFTVTFDTDFSSVIQQCAVSARKGQESTWITKDMIDAYGNLHELGYAHSVEVWQEDKLVGGMYGVSLGKCFFGESMFHKVSNASKVALIFLVQWLQKNDFHFLDAQVYTDHVATLGAIEIPRKDFLALLKSALSYETKMGKWDINS